MLCILSSKPKLAVMPTNRELRRPDAMHRIDLHDILGSVTPMGLVASLLGVATDLIIRAVELLRQGLDRLVDMAREVFDPIKP